MLTAENTLAVFASRTRQLYSLPAVAIEVLELTDQPRVDCRQLQRCIERDPALVSKVLRVVNSSLFGLGTPVSNLNQAVALLGIKPLKLLVLGFSLSEVMFKGETGAAMQHAWRFTLTRAVAARELCESVWHVSGDEAFIAALLADLGKFVLLDELGEPYANLVLAAKSDGDSLIAFERSSLGFDHTQLTIELLSHWKLPEVLVSTVRLASDPDRLAMLEAPDNFLPIAVRTAGLIADSVVDGRHDSLAEALTTLRDAELELVVHRLQECVGSLAEALSFELPQGQDYRDVLVAAHERLARLATDAACVTARQWPIADKRGAEVADLATAVAQYVARFDQSQHHDSQPGKKPSLVAHLPATSIETDKLLERLATVIARCREARRPLSLLLVELHDASQLKNSLGETGARRAVEQLRDAAVAIEHPGKICLRLGNASYALIIANADRRAAIKLGHQLLASMQSPAVQAVAAKAPAVSIGLASVALPSKNFAPSDLFDAAERCMSAAQLSGGSTLKSIDVY